MKRFLLSLLLLLPVMFAQAGNNIMYDKANQLYRNRNYDSACKMYQQMINDGYSSAALFYNAGNAYYRTNKVGMAVWCYEKALLLKPSYKSAADNLALARKRIKEPIEPVADIFFIRWWRSVYSLFTVNQWALFSLILFLAGLAVSASELLQFRLRFPRVLKRGVFTASLLCLTFMAIASYNDAFHFRAVVVESDALIKLEGRKEAFYIHEGIVVRVLEKNKTQVLVRLPDGREGKMNRSELLKL
ncbi:MAG TPA: tetratricopeptide repeat protein [Chitinophagaceae bacterium]|nr:tetratricopeptide repeat protein [Chitinophagaceae bacterium]